MAAAPRGRAPQSGSIQSGQPASSLSRRRSNERPAAVDRIRRYARWVTWERPVLLVDAFALLFRALHALPDLRTKRGEPTGALYGFSSVLLKLLREERPRGVALALDAPDPTFRHHL